MDVPDKLPTVLQLVYQVKMGTVNQVIQSPVREGWAIVWKDTEGNVWSRLKIDDGESCPLGEPKLEAIAKPPKIKKKSNFNPFGSGRKKKVESNGHV